MESKSPESQGHSPLRIALIGTSGIAAVYVKSLRRMHGVTLEWIHSRNEQRAKTFAAQWGIAKYTSNLDTLFGEGTIDAVLIATEPHRHIDVALQALRAGKHMLIEKPLDVSVQKAEQFVAQAKSFDGVISVVSQNRFNPVLQEMKARLATEAVGQPKSVQLTMMWHRDREYYQKGSGWRGEHSAIFLNQGIHWLDILNWFFGEPVRVQATSRSTRSFLSCVDQTTAVIDYPDNTSVSLCGGTFCDRTYPDQFCIYYEQGVLNYDALRAAHTPEKAGGFTRFWKRQSPQKSGDAELFLRQVLDFIGAIRQNRPPVTTLENALQALRVACLLSQPEKDALA